MISPYFLANTRGIARIASTGVTVGTADVTVHFRQHGALNSPYRGLILIRLTSPIPAGTTLTLPVKFSSGTSTSTVTPTKLGDNPITVADMPGTGVYLFYYDNVDGILQQVSGTI